MSHDTKIISPLPLKDGHPHPCETITIAAVPIVLDGTSPSAPMPLNKGVVMWEKRTSGNEEDVFGTKWDMRGGSWQAKSLFYVANAETPHEPFWAIGMNRSIVCTDSDGLLYTVETRFAASPDSSNSRGGLP
jgi:hypothetical protein